MAIVEFNYRPIDVDINSIRTIAELIPCVKSNHLDQTEYLTNLVINGEEVTGQNQSLYLNRKIEANDLIQFEASNSKDLIMQTIDELPGYIDSLIDTIDLTVKFAENSQHTLVFALMKDVAGKIDSFIQLISQIHQGLTINSDQRLESGHSIKQLEIHLLSVTKALLTAQKKEDHVMLIDLLDYELKDNLTQWKITVIPQIKRINTI